MRYKIQLLIFALVPFVNITLPPNNNIQANYSFGNSPAIYCFENTLQMIGLMQWPYHGTINTATLSQNSLTTNTAIFEGFPADPNGTITIINNSNVALVVSCQFAF